MMEVNLLLDEAALLQQQARVPDFNEGDRDV